MAEEQRKKVHELLEEFDTAMLVTQGEGQLPHARPMAIARVEAGGGVWFFSGRDSAKVHEIQHEQHVLIVCQKGHRLHLTLSGRAQLSQDRNRAKELWKESYKAWFPGGPNDPNLVLIFVRPEAAEYWDAQGVQGVRYLFEAARAYAKGERPRVEEGEQHGKVALS